MPAALPSQRHERAELSARMRADGLTWAEIAVAFRARYRVNARAAARLARGWSQGEVAARWTARWPDDPKTSKHISYWEQWPGPTGREPGLRILFSLACLYECAVADLLADVGDYRETGRTPQVPDSSGELPAAGPPYRLSMARLTVARRLTAGEPLRQPLAVFLPEPAGTTFAVARSEPAIETWLSAPESALCCTGRGTQVARDDIDVARGVLGMFRQLDHAHGAGSSVRWLVGYIDTELAGLLARPSADRGVAAERGHLAAEFLELAGYQAVDAGRNGTAQAFYQRALAAATMAGDTAYGGYLAGVSLGHLALHAGHPDVALAWAVKALSGMGTAASPAIRAAVTAVSARALARLGREQETTAALLTCERLLNAASLGNEPDWIGYFSYAYLSDEIAHCMHELGRFSTARPEAESALAGVGTSHVRRLAIDAALLASIFLRSGDLDQACTMGRRAAEYTARTSSGRCRQRVTTLLADMSAYRLSPCVADLARFVREVLPEASDVS
jgi:hypothetical protein